MSETVSRVFDFACANPDYWELMRQAHEPPEVAELDSRRRDAFNAARSEVQRQYCALLDAVHAHMKEMAQDTPMRERLSKGFNRQSYEKAVFGVELVAGRGKQTWATMSLEEGTSGRISAYCGLKTALQRESEMQEAFRSAVNVTRLQFYSQWVYVEEPIHLGDSLDDIASRLVGVFWPGVLAYSEKLADTAERSTLSEDADED
jgi:hypothetical protein